MDRGDAKKLPPSALPMCEVEPLRLEEEGSDRCAAGLWCFGSSQGWAEGALNSQVCNALLRVQAEFLKLEEESGQLACAVCVCGSQGLAATGGGLDTWDVSLGTNCIDVSPASGDYRPGLSQP